MKRTQILLITICLISIYALCVMTRIGIQKAAVAKEGFLPFTMEGAFLYHFSNEIAHGKIVPHVDVQAQSPEGFDAAAKLSLTPDYILGGIYRKFFNKILYAKFLRMAQPVFLTLSVFIVFWISTTYSKIPLYGLWAALLYGLSLSSVIRSTGIEYSRENFGLPFLFLHFALLIAGCPKTQNLFFERSREVNSELAICHKKMFSTSSNNNIRCFRGALIKEILAALSLTLACTIWDGSQIYFTIWVIYEIIRFLFLSNQPSLSQNIANNKTLISSPPNVDPPWEEKAQRFNNLLKLLNIEPLNSRLVITLCFLIPASLIHPYLRDHFFIYSPAMMGLYSLCLCSRISKRRKFIFLSTLSILILLWTTSPYLGIYEHMLQLIFYKIKFLNVKPPHPAELPFDVRLLWTPALHAATLESLKGFLPVLPLVIMSFIAQLRQNIRQGPTLFFLLFFSTVSFILTLAFVRLEVYLIFFLACLIGSIPLGINPRRISVKLIWNSCIILILLVEAENLTNNFYQFERDVPYPHLNMVVKWIKENTPKKSVVLANFGLSPSILAYAHRGIVLHPKYESRDMRRKIKDFSLSLFDEKEEPFYRYCINSHALYYVHTLGTFQDHSLYSWRYMADRLKPTKETIAERFEFGKILKGFYPLYDTGKYRVYRVIQPKEFQRIQILKEKSDVFLAKGLWEEAESRLLMAQKMNPNDFMIHFKLARLYNMEGFARKAIEITKEGLRKARSS